MSDFTVQDVRDFFTGEYEHEPFEDGYDEFLWDASRRPDRTFSITLNGEQYTAVIVEEYDDEREWTRDMHYVFEIGDRVFKFPGKFISHDGSHWYPEDITEGKLVTKPVLVWE